MSNDEVVTVERCLPPSLLPSEEKEGERSSNGVLNLLSHSFSPSRKVEDLLNHLCP